MRGGSRVEMAIGYETMTVLDVTTVVIHIDYKRSQETAMPMPPITDAEWELMNVLWEGPRSALEIADALERHPKTVKTLLGRLVRKGVLRFREEGNRYVYSPAIPRQRYI